MFRKMFSASLKDQTSSLTSFSMTCVVVRPWLCPLLAALDSRLQAFQFSGFLASRLKHDAVALPEFRPASSLLFARVFS